MNKIFYFMVRSQQDNKLFDIYLDKTKINTMLEFEDASAIVLKLNNDVPETSQEEVQA